MLELPNIWSHDLIYNIANLSRMIKLCWDAMDRSGDVITFLLIYLYFNKTQSSRTCWYHRNCNHIFKNNL